MLANPHIQSIELALESQFPGSWKRLDATNSHPLKNKVCGWKVDLPAGFVTCPVVDYLLIVIDTAFPQSQPRIFAPQAFQETSWPHVEAEGLLCLRSTMINSDAGQRVLQHLSWAQELLNFNEKTCRSEFEREFSSYWLNNIPANSNSPAVISLLSPNAISREVVWFYDLSKQRIIVADSRDLLVHWLRNSDHNPSDKEVSTCWLAWLPSPWVPNEFPTNGIDVLKYIPTQFTDLKLHPGKILPVIFGAETSSGIVLVATILEGVSEAKLVKGFRNVAAVPKQLIRNSFKAGKVRRCCVYRVDGSWIHGRDHDSNYPYLAKRKVAIIGCGAIGAAVARLLVQSGVGSFILVDHDLLSSPNISRHALGLEYLGVNKATATAAMLKKSFPHINEPLVINQKIEYLTPEQLAKLVECDVVVSCGISYEGDIKIDTWRQSLTIPPVFVCAWTEEFAIAGHAIALLGHDVLSDGFDAQEQVKFKLTQWPAQSHALIVEAGCGNVFQPHGIIDLQETINLAAGLVVDALCGKLPHSTRRVWQGKQEEVTKRGGTVLPTFTHNLTVQEYPWK